MKDKSQRKQIPSPKRLNDTLKKGTVGKGSDNNNKPPSPWLNSDNEPSPDQSASFVEYLRWMRSYENQHREGTKVQILQKAEENANYTQRLQQLNTRTKLLAGENNTFEVTSPWRIRVGGHRGPESILLPAFDALGMPYIPSSTLRGVARCQAIRHFMERDNSSWEEAEKKIATFFGALDAADCHKSGKVVFFDAYSLPSKSGGLAVDIANNIWSWNNTPPKYSPNPNPFLSLKESTFLIGLRLASNCQDEEILKQVKEWLILGLSNGIGSQVNTGYGELLTSNTKSSKDKFFNVKFTLKGQLIHGRQKFTQWNLNNRSNEWQMRGKADAEVRPIAFKSMLRYWFRTFALGVLPPTEVKTWESTLFGGINPKFKGWLKVTISNGKTSRKEPQNKNDECGEQKGDINFNLSSDIPDNKKQPTQTLIVFLTWIMCHLGGIGQGARRPCYSRKNNESIPWYRGASFERNYKQNNSFWYIPPTIEEFQKLFLDNLKQFYKALAKITTATIDYRSCHEVDKVSNDKWAEAVDKNCQIWLFAGLSNTNKPYALKELHEQFHRLENTDMAEAKNLCGGTKKDKLGRDAISSPIWIADLGEYQIVTIFGATEDPRKTYLETLKKNAKESSQIFPFQ